MADLDATVRFYRAVGLDVDHISDMLARASWGGEAVLEFGTEVLTRSYDPAFETPGRPSKSTTNFELATREAVDAKFAELVALGYSGHLAPIDALWGARFAIVEDPDGNFVGFHSPRAARPGGGD